MNPKLIAAISTSKAKKSKKKYKKVKHINRCPDMHFPAKQYDPDTEPTFGPLPLVVPLLNALPVPPPPLIRQQSSELRLTPVDEELINTQKVRCCHNCWLDFYRAICNECDYVYCMPNAAPLPQAAPLPINLNDHVEKKEEKKEEFEKKDEPKKEYKNQSIQVVHISDTHLKHKHLESIIPYGDILIHSGDFVQKCRLRGNENKIHPKQLEQYIIENKLTTVDELKKYIPVEVLEFNDWLATLPHKYKVVIGGNHEICFNSFQHKFSKEFIQKYLLTNCFYLQDSWVKILGLKIYGTPWTKCNKTMGFSYGGRKEFIYKKWKAIPNDTDIVVSHLPPRGIFDLAWGAKYNNKQKCKLCGEIHKSFKHWGCQKLLENITNRIKPKLHLFGHVHDSVGYQLDKENDILFINSAMDIQRKAHRVKLVFDL